MKFDMSIFQKSVKKTQVSLKSDNNNRYMKTELHFLWISVFLRKKNVSDKSCRENQNTHFFKFKNFLFKKSCCLWDTVEKYCRARQATDDNIVDECWILNTQNKSYLLLFHWNSGYINAPQMLCYTYSACLVSLNWVTRELPCIYFLNYLLCNSMHLHQNASQQTIHTILL